jgi:hypothetical protein
VLPVAADGVRFEFVIDEGGLLCESSRCLGVMTEVLGMLLGRLFVAGVLPGRLFVAGALRDGMFGATARKLFVLFTGALPARPEVSPVLLSVRTRIWDAPCAGAVRAITVRF